MSVPSGLPVIDIGPFLESRKSTDQDRQECARSIATACEEHGFFYLINHCISGSRTQKILDQARTFFFEATDAEKAALARLPAGTGAGDGARGYQRVGENVTQGKRDWHEAVDLYREVTHDEPPYKTVQGKNLWPSTPPELRQTYEEYIQELLGLGQAVVRAMGLALDPKDEEVFVNQTRNSFWVMRMIGYPPKHHESHGTENVEEDQDAGISCGEHTDYGCVTFLLADSTKGALQVELKDGSWLNADPLPGAFVVNIGDMMERWTNGLWKSTNHRVIHTGKDWRFSVPFFYEPDYDARVAPLPGCVERTGGKAKYGEVSYGEHLLGKIGGNFYGGEG